MSFVTFVRDYIQDPNRIVHIPNFIFDACKEFFWYIFSFQWFRNLIYITLASPSPKQTLSHKVAYPTGIQPLHTLYDFVNKGLLVGPNALQVQNTGTLNQLSQNTNQIENFLHDNSWLNTSFELPSEQLSLFHNSLYGFFNGLSSTFHFCAVTILIIHVLLNENKNRAFKIALASCFGDVSCIIAVLFGFTGLVVPWLTLEPLSYVLGFAIQFFFALEIIKDNRRIKANFDKVRQFDQGNSLGTRTGQSQESKQSQGKGKDRRYGLNIASNSSERGQLSFNRWLVPSLILFSWCEQTRFFQGANVFSLQPTATLLEIPGFIYHTRELQILIYLFAFIATRVIFTWLCLSIFQNLINNIKPLKSSNSNIFNFRVAAQALQRLPSKLKSLLTNSGRQKAIIYVKDSSLKIWLYLLDGARIKNLFYSAFSWFIPKSLHNKNQSELQNKEVISAEFSYAKQSNYVQRDGLQEMYVISNQKRKKLQHLLLDSLAIAAVTCSLAFLPAYSTNLLVTKSAGFFPEENRIKHSLFSPWDMPATVLASDMDFISNHPNLAEYPFFLPFYDKGEYGGWLGVGEEDIRYGPFRLWQSRRIRAPWRRTTLQEPALTFANDKSLFINPLLRTPNLKKSTIGYYAKQANQANDLFQETANIKAGAIVGPVSSFASLDPLESSSILLAYPQGKQAKHKPYLQSKHTNQKIVSTSRIYNDAVHSKQEKQVGVKQLGKALVAYPTGKQGIARDSKQGFQEQVENNLLVDEKKLTNGLDYLWKQLKTQSAYTKLLVINSTKPLALNKTVTPKEQKSKILSRSSLTFQPTINQPVLTQNTVKIENSKITKAGRKKIIEVLKKPLRKVKTSTLDFDSFTPSLENLFRKQSGLKHKQNNLLKTFSDVFDSFINKTYAYLPLQNKQSNPLEKRDVRILKETQIKDNKQIRKRFKKFKKKLRLFRTRAYKKRNTKIKRLKHFHYIRNKNKKRRKSRRLIYKLRRQYPYIRNIKERKAEIFGLYSTTQGSHKSVLDLYSKQAREGVKQNEDPRFASGLSSELKIHKINFQDRPNYLSEYPKKKDFINVKKDFNLIFRTQIGERLDFAQEEIRARIFINPYVRFLLNNRIDTFVSRSNKAALPTHLRSSTFKNKQKDYAHKQAVTNQAYALQSNPTGMQVSPATEEKDLKENDLFKRRLIISKYADAVDFLKPSLRHSYVDRVYNHQFKGTLSTARRLFSLKVQYDQSLAHPLNYKSAIEHEGLLNNTQQEKHDSDDQKTKSKTLSNYNKQQQEHGDKIQKQANTIAENHNEIIGNKTDNQNLEFQSNFSNLLEKGGSAPLYAVWDPQLRKLILTNRYLNHKTVTTLANYAFASHNKKVQDSETKTSNQVEWNETNLTSYKSNKIEKTNNNLIQFTNWPLKESYFKDNEFLVSQLYSNSQPIDSFLSQENEKARSVALPRRVNSFNTVLNQKNNVQPTDAQRSQQFLKLESNDKKTFLFKHLWNSSNTASGLTPILSSNSADPYPVEVEKQTVDTKQSKSKPSLKNQNMSFFSTNVHIPTSAEQRKANRVEEREYALWMVLKALPPNQGGFLWPGD